MTARRSPAGRSRPASRPCRACSPRRWRRFCGEKVAVSGAGRTDAGVHALGQVAHIDLGKDWDTDTVRDALNAQSAAASGRGARAPSALPDDFDARFSARARHYLYRIVNRRADLALDRGRAWRVPRPLDAAGDASRRPAASRQARLHDFPRRRMPGEIAGQDARPARRGARGRRNPRSLLRRAPSCITRCARWSARWRWWARGDGARRN